MMPTPSHLAECVERKEAAIDESALDADVRCPCGSRIFDLLYPGQTTDFRDSRVPVVAEIDGNFFFIIRARCVECEREHLLLDKDLHGWEGFICHDAAQASLPRPELKEWRCLECGAMPHTASIQIETQGKKDFIDETDGEFSEERWTDAFSWFSMSIHCTRCDKDTPVWVSYETM